MPILSLRNAYYRGWFAARGRRNAPNPIMLEERFFIDVGFTDGERSPGGPLEQWSKDIPPGTPANLANYLRSDEPVFTTRRTLSDHPPSAMRPARKQVVSDQSELRAPAGYEDSQAQPNTQAEIAPARSEPVQRTAASASNEEDSETEESDPAGEDEPTPAVATEKAPARMPEKKPQFNLPRRSYGGGPSVKRRSVKR
jgi:hypothetical protein